MQNNSVSQPGQYRRADQQPPSGMPENKEICVRARTALSGRWLKTIGVALLVALFLEALSALFSSLLIHGFQMYTYSDVNGRTLSSAGGYVLQLLNTPIKAILTLGLYRYYLAIAKGEAAAVRTCLYFIKNQPLTAIGLTLKIALMMILWMLPGFGVMLLAVFMGSAGTFFLWVGGILAIALGVSAIFRYALIPVCMAENPEHTIGKAFEEGKEAMEGQKWNLFCLWFLAVGWANLAVIVLQLAIRALGAFPYSLIMTVLISPLTVYWGLASVIFYLERKRILTPVADVKVLHPQSERDACKTKTEAKTNDLEGQVADLTRKLDAVTVDSDSAPDEPSEDAHSPSL